MNILLFFLRPKNIICIIIPLCLILGFQLYNNIKLTLIICAVAAVVYLIIHFGEKHDEKFGPHYSQAEREYRKLLATGAWESVLTAGRYFYTVEKGIDPLTAEAMIANDIKQYDKFVNRDRS